MQSRDKATRVPFILSVGWTGKRLFPLSASASSQVNPGMVLYRDCESSLGGSQVDPHCPISCWVIVIFSNHLVNKEVENSFIG